METLAIVAAWIVFAGLCAYHGSNVLMMILAALELRRQRAAARMLSIKVIRDSGHLHGVSVIIPAFNEEVAIVRTVQSVLAVNYPNLEAIVVSDGSTDRTIVELARAFDLRPWYDEVAEEVPSQKIRAMFQSQADARLKVIDKRNGGKADALNVGINVASKRLILAVDADVILDADAVTHLALPFMEDHRTVATSGMIRPQNGTSVERGRIGRTALPSTMLEQLQVLEYLRAYGVGRLCFNWIGAHLIISGAFGLFERKALVTLGGYQPHAVGEDMELVVRIHRHMCDGGIPYRVFFSADALCLTEAPHSLADFGKQRTRWHMGLLSTLRIHRYMMLRPRYGAIGLVAFPFFVLELFAPVLEALALIGFPLAWLTGALSGERVVWMLLTGVLLSTSVSLWAVLIDTAGFRFLSGVKPRLVLALLGFIEHFGYRQLTVVYRLRAFERYYRTIQLRSGWKSPARAAARPNPGADVSRTTEPT